MGASGAHVRVRSQSQAIRGVGGPKQLQAPLDGRDRICTGRRVTTMQSTSTVALVTGGAHRIGRSLVLRLASRGITVLFTFNSSESAAAETAAAARALGGTACALRCDLTDLAAVEHMVDTITEHHGGVDILINNASAFESTPFPGHSTEAWNRVIRLALDGTYHLCNLLAPGLVARRNGVIINIGDLSAHEPWPGRIAHAVGKAGLLAMSRQWALELAPAVRSNALVLGPILPGQETDQEAVQRVADSTLLGRWGCPNDVADAVEFLLHASYITGAELTIDGGQQYAHLRAGRFGA